MWLFLRKNASTLFRYFLNSTFLYTPTHTYDTMSTLYKAAELVKTKSNDRKAKDKRINKQRVMMLSSRGVTFR